MGKRRKQFISDDDLDSSSGLSDEGSETERAGDFDDEDIEERAERLRTSGRKRRRRGNGKEEALYGIWAEREDDGGDMKAGAGGRSSNKALRRPQAFVPSSAAAASTNEASMSNHSDKPMDLAEAIPMPTTAPADGVEDSSAEEDEGGDENEDDDSSSSGSDSDDSDKPKVRIPRNRDEEEAEMDKENEDLLKAAMSNDGQPGAQRGGIGAKSRGGIGSTARAAAAAVVPEPIASSSSLAAPSQTALNADDRSTTGTPEPSSSFGAAARERRSFLTGGGSAQSSRAGTPSNMRKAAAPISKTEQMHFNKLASSGGVGFKLLQKMGWSAGTGLGATGEGIVTPIESKLRPKAMGLAYEGFTERTKQSKEEEKRRRQAAGEEVSSDEEDAKKRRGKKGKGKERGEEGKENQRPPAWKQPKPRKAKVQHMTYEDIVSQSAGGASSGQGGVGVIYDLTGKELSTAALSSGHHHDVPTSDSTRLPEIRHNIALIADATKSDLDNLAREAKNVKERRAWLVQEEGRVRKAVQDDEGRIARLQAILSASQQVQKIAAGMSGFVDKSTEQQLSAFEPSFETLLDTATQEEYEAYKLDEVVVGAILPIMKRAWLEWDPLAEPLAYLNSLRKLRKLLRLQQRDKPSDSADEQAVDIFSAQTYNTAASLPPRRGKQPERGMTAFESLLWTLWMPRLRSAINNDWNPAFPNPVIELYAGWKSSGLLPRFILDNMLDQLVLPKVRKAIADWMPPRRGKTATPAANLHHIVFPWLEHAGERMEEILDEAKRRVRGWLKSWRVRDGVPDGLDAWKDVIPPKDWDTLILQNVVPQLSAHLRDRFTVNPRQQDLAPLSLVLSWKGIMRSSILSQLLEAEFFPKFLDALYTWLVASGVNYEQVAQWYSYWKKEVFANVQTLPGVERGFAKALDLMNQAMALGDDAKYRLKKPDTSVLPPEKAPAERRDKHRENGVKAIQSRVGADESDITFRSVVEEVAADNNLVFMATGRSHDVSGMPLFRVSSSIDGKSGLTVYLQGDVVYAMESGGVAKPISVQAMVERAQKA